MDIVTRLIVALVLALAGNSCYAVGSIAAYTGKVFSCARVTDNKTMTGTDLWTVIDSCLPASVHYNWGTQTYAAENCDPTPQPARCDNVVYTLETGSTIIIRQVSGYRYASWSVKTTCPENSSLFQDAGVSKCACNANYLQQNGKCQQYTCPPSGGYSAVTQPDQLVPNAGDQICTGGCGYKPTSWKVGNDGKIWATWPFKSTGSFCGGDKKGTTPEDTGEKNTSNPAPVPCGSNQCPGQVNGATICVPCKGQQTDGPSSSASAPGQSASAPAGTSSTTTCNGVSCTTTTITRDGTGAIIGTKDETKPQDSFCRENPESPLCKRSSFGGQCAATACEGDAIQCAIAADQYKRNCQWFDDPATPAMSDAGQAAMTNTLRPDDHPYNVATTQSVGFNDVIDQTDRLAGGCPSDMTVSINGRPLVVPFSKSCAPLQMLGTLLVGLTALACVFIVFR